MTPEEMDRLASSLHDGSSGFGTVDIPKIRSALARAHAEGKAEGLEEAARWFEGLEGIRQIHPQTAAKAMRDLVAGQADKPDTCCCGFPRSDHTPSRGCVELFLYGPSAPRSLIPAAPQPAPAAGQKGEG